MINILFHTWRLTAEETVNEFTRVVLREVGFFHRILPPVPLANDVLIGDGPSAIPLPFTELPANTQISGPAYRVMFDRLQREPRQ